MCELCEGRGEVEEEVPNDEIFTPDMQDFLACFGAYRRHGVLPERGALLDQAATFVDAATYLDGMIDRMLEEDRPKEGT